MGWTLMVTLSLTLLGCNFSDDSREVTGGSEPADGKQADAKQPTPDSGERAELVIAGGCFWCVEAVFEELDGVIEAVSGYAGDTEATANYDAVSSGSTKHAEAVRIVFDPKRIDFEKLLAVHFATHDPTTKNRQGNDWGPQYRSAIFYANDEEKQAAEAMIKRLDDAKAYPRPIVTTLEPLEKFYAAEHYHQNYACDNPGNPYIQNIALPKVDKVRKLFKEDLKQK